MSLVAVTASSKAEGLEATYSWAFRPGWWMEGWMGQCLERFGVEGNLRPNLIILLTQVNVLDVC